MSLRKTSIFFFLLYRREIQNALQRYWEHKIANFIIGTGQERGKKNPRKTRESEKERERVKEIEKSY